MTAGIARLAFELLLQGVSTFPDTIITKQVAVEQGAFSKVASVAQGLMTIAILVLTVVLVPAAWNFRNSYKRINELIDRFYGDIGPLVRNANTIADNVNYITTSIRVDVGQFNQTVALANERLTAAVKLAERRIRELDALMRVVQREAEDAFVTTAATLRGVQVGAAALRDDVGDELADEAFDENQALEDEEALEEREETNGDYGETQGEWSERPRVRPRPSERA